MCNNQRSYYNKISSDYDDTFENQTEYRNFLYKNFLNKIDYKNFHILDAMSGGGQNSLFFANNAKSIKAIDISDKQIEKYRKRFPYFEAVCSDILKNNFKNDEFDLIITDSLHHLHPNIDLCMKEFNRILKKNGYLILWEPTSGSFFDYFRKIWYQLDTKFFESNEKSINLNDLVSKNKEEFELINKKYGGNIYYLLCNVGMAFRINLKSKLIKNFLRLVENILDKFQFKFNSLFFIALLKKK